MVQGEHLIVRSGVDSYTIYGAEETFGTKSTAINKIFGVIKSFTPNSNRNFVRVQGQVAALPEANDEHSGRDTLALLRGTYEAGCNIDFQPQNWKFMEYVLGSVSGSGTGVAPYSYPQATASDLADKLKYVRLPSLTISNNFYFGGTGDAADTAIDILGCKVDSCSISASTGEPVSVSLTLPGVEAKPGTLNAGVALDSEDVYHFVGSSVYLPTATAMANIVDNFTLNINNSVTRKHGLGSDKAKALVAGNREISLSMQVTSESVEWLKANLGGTELGSPTVFGEAKLLFEGDGGRQFEIFMKDVKINSNEFSASHPDPVNENLELIPTLIWCEEVV